MFMKGVPSYFLIFFLCVAEAGLNFDENLDIIELRHPSTDGPGMFLLSADNTVIQEVQTFSDDLR